MKRNKLTIGGLLLITAALCFLLYNTLDEMRADTTAQKIQQELTVQLPDDMPEIEDGNDSDKIQQMPVAEIEGENYIGILEIPSLGLRLPVMEMLSDDGLKISPCRYSGSVYEDHIIIAAHNYKRHFGRIKNLVSGDRINFTDMDGRTFCYRVSCIEELSAISVEKMKSGNWNMTLFTCTVGGKTRIAVRCTRDLSN